MAETHRVRPLLPILTGATAAGKTALAIELAERLDLEIISADSRQVYADLPVSTAAPTPEERERVKHHLVGFLPLEEDYSAGRFVADARGVLGLPEPELDSPAVKDRDPDPPSGESQAVAANAGEGPLMQAPLRPPRFLLCGGSGFYIRAFLDPVHPSLGATPRQRGEVKRQSAELSGEELKARLLELDPESHWIPAADRSKLERYIEISLATGMPASRAMRELRLPRPVVPVVFALDCGLNWLGPRIRKRAWRMLRHGMLDEVRRALDRGLPAGCNALRSVGVEEAAAHLRGEIDLPRCHELVSRKTRQYARKQITWSRGLPRVEFLDPRLESAELVERMAVSIDQVRRGGADTRETDE